MSGSGISWAICKSAPRSRQITTPAPHHSVFLQTGCPSCRPTNSVKDSKHWNFPLEVCPKLRSYKISPRQVDRVVNKTRRRRRVCWRHLYDNRRVVPVYCKSVNCNPLTPFNLLWIFRTTCFYSWHNFDTSRLSTRPRHLPGQYHVNEVARYQARVLVLRHPSIDS